MDATYGRIVALAAPIFFLSIALEAILNRIRGTRYYNLTDALNSVGCGIAFSGVRVLYGFTGLVAYDFISRHWAPIRLPDNHWATWLFAFVAYDFCYYWWHRLSHRVGFLWGAHVVHHQSEEFNLTTAIRQPATALFSGWIFYLPLAFCGVSLGVYLAVGVAQLFYQFWPHTRHIGRLGWLDRWIQTPSNHRVHHAKNSIYLDKNYVGVFLIWDRLFGTFQEERDEEPCVYGILDDARPWNPVWANLHFYWSLASDSWHTRSWLDKIRVWFAPPGWRPADLSPRQRQFADPERGGRFLAMSIYALVQFAATTAANQHFLTIFPHQTPLANLLYFGLILTGLVVVSALLEARRDFFAVEIVRLTLIALFAIGSGIWAILAFALVSVAWFGSIWRSGYLDNRHGV